MADTIAAIATPLGEGGVGIVRVSGPNSLSIMKSIQVMMLLNFRRMEAMYL